MKSDFDGASDCPFFFPFFLSLFVDPTYSFCSFELFVENFSSIFFFPFFPWNYSLILLRYAISLMVSGLWSFSFILNNLFCPKTVD